MIKEKINSNKGITLVSLVVSIIILLILSTISIYGIKSSNNISPYNNMVADIKLLEDKILVYYNKYGEIPKISRSININDINYYEIDLSKLDNLTLNYGQEYGESDELVINKSDVYVVNDSLEVYYIQGVNLSGERYYEIVDAKEYIELEYIESTGTQYIDTGIYGNINIKADLIIEATNKANVSVIGTDKYTWSTEYVFQLYNNNFHAFKAANKKPLGDNTRFKIHLDPTGESSVEGIGSVNSGMTEIANTKIYIAKWGSYLGAFKMYSCKFYENDTIIRDFIPCKDKEGIVCLYDKVEGKYYYNQGTGEFLAGPEV